MDILQKISVQMQTVGMPLYAVTLTAVPRADTPMLLILHWHGFRREESEVPFIRPQYNSVPGSALQLNDRWNQLEHLDAAMLDAAWQLGAWDVEREERRPCNWVGASQMEALECRQAFGDYSVHLEDEESLLLAEAPDRSELMHLGARVGYVRWQFRPVMGGVWQETADDDTLASDGSRKPPCPVAPQAARGGKVARTRYRLGRVNRIIVA